MKTQQSPKTSPGKIGTPKKMQKTQQSDVGVISPSKSNRSERSERSQVKSDKSNIKESASTPSSQNQNPEAKQNPELLQKYIEIKQLKQLNIRLAASAQQVTRDAALTELVEIFVNKSLWFQNIEEDKKAVEDTSENKQNQSDIFQTKVKVNQKVKNLRMVWEGLFFLIWHSDKPTYQKECCEKIANIMDNLNDNERKKEWFTQFLFIFNMHWDKVDNFRIDKFLMFLRFMFNRLLRFLQENGNNHELIAWYQNLVQKLFVKSEQEGAETATGIPLQICDIFIPEMNNVQPDASLETLAALLDPFLKTLGIISNGELKERVIDKIFHPLLENNKTEQEEESSDEEEKMKKQEHYHRFIDGGQLPPKTKKEIMDKLKQKYVFSGFNILIYAQNYIFKQASSVDTSIMKNDYRDQVYQLYEYALELDPKPDREQLTFAQQLLVNRARTFVTMKMKRRQNIRDQKAEQKKMMKLRHMLSDQVMGQQKQIQQEIEMEEDDEEEEDKNKVVGKKRAFKIGSLATFDKDAEEDEDVDDKVQEWVPLSTLKKMRELDDKIKKPKDDDEDDDDDVELGEDKVMNVAVKDKKKKKRTRKRKGKEDASDKKNNEGSNANMKVHFDLSQNKVTEFFKHGKVAQRVLD